MWQKILRYIFQNFESEGNISPVRNVTQSYKTRNKSQDMFMSK